MEEGLQRLQAAAKRVGKGRAMKGEGGDRRVDRNGRAWRVRVRLFEEKAPVAPVNGNPDLSPTGFSVVISLALLDAADAVARDSSDRLLVFDRHVLTIQADTFANDPAFDVDTHIRAAIDAEIDKAEAILIGKEKLAEALDPWTAKAGEIPVKE